MTVENSVLEEDLINRTTEAFEDITKTEVGTKERQMAVEDAVKLYRVGMDRIKMEGEIEASADQRVGEFNRRSKEEEFRERELELKERELELRNAENAEKRSQEKSERRFNRIMFGVNTALAVANLMVALDYINRGFKLEETGTYTSKTLSNVINWFAKPKR